MNKINHWTRELIYYAYNLQRLQSISTGKSIRKSHKTVRNMGKREEEAGHRQPGLSILVKNKFKN